MRKLSIALLLGMVSAAALGQSPAAVDPLAPVAWLAGGTWKAEAPNPAGGANTKIEQRMERELNGKAIRFATTFNGVTQYEGFFAWDAAKQQITFAYPSADGDLTNGVATATPDGILLDFTIDDAAAKTAHYQVRIKKSTADDYTWTLFAAGASNAWNPLFQVKYHREN